MKRICLPYPPSVNRYWRHNRGRTHISAKGKQYAQDACDILECIEPLKNCRIWLDIELYMPDNRKRDIDNALKPILDAIERSGIIEDDEQIDQIHVRRMGLKRKKGCAVIKIGKMDTGS